ncbi:MAG: YraN family protein [Hyphomicrobiaceae bacterium]
MSGRATGPPRPGRATRQQRYRKGHVAEWLARLVLRLKGYRILERRYRVPVGEIDIVAVRGRRLAFVEVKHRPTLALAGMSLSARQRERIIRAAEHWLARHPRYQEHEFGLDLMLMAPRAWPRHLPNAFHRPWSAPRKDR